MKKYICASLILAYKFIKSCKIILMIPFTLNMNIILYTFLIR